MSTTDNSHASDLGWEHIGRAAEHFARRVARDAEKFAERLQEHAGEFADDVSRDWRRARREYHRGCHRLYREMGRPDVRRILDDVRTVLSDVLDGVDQLIGDIFAEPAAADDATAWVRMVNNRDTTCGACGRAIAAGEEGYVRRTSEGKEFRCCACGAPPPGASAS
jgi:hypothetical protein